MTSAPVVAQVWLGSGGQARLARLLSVIEVREVRLAERGIRARIVAV